MGKIGSRVDAEHIFLDSYLMTRVAHKKHTFRFWCAKYRRCDTASDMARQPPKKNGDRNNNQNLLRNQRWATVFVSFLSNRYCDVVLFCHQPLPSAYVQSVIQGYKKMLQRGVVGRESNASKPLQY